MSLTTRVLFYAVLFSAMVGLTRVSQAADVAWIGGDGDYLDSTNWASGIIPISDNENALVAIPGVSVTLNAAAPDMHRLAIRNDAEMTIGPNGSLRSLGFSFLGRVGPPGTVGTLNLNGGSFRSTGFIAGRDGGVLNMNGGDLTATTKFHIGDKLDQGGGAVHLDGGVIFATDFLMGPGPAMMDITAGVMQVIGDVGPDIDGYVADGILTAYGGAGTVKHSFDRDSGITTIAAVIPEPTSMMLLGVASVLLAAQRRK